MSILGRYTKQPAEVESYTIDYSDDLIDGDTISATTVVVSGNDAALLMQGKSADSTSLRIWLSGGTDRERYKVTATVTTSDGRVLQDEFLISVKDV